MARFRLSRCILWRTFGVALAVTPLVGRATGRYLERAHRREFLAQLAIPSTEAALTSDSALEVLVRESVLRQVPLGSDTLVVKIYVQHLRVSSSLVRLSDHMNTHDGPPDHLWLPFSERVRWFEFGVCEWTRGVDFELDNSGVVRQVSTERIGSCI